MSLLLPLALATILTTDPLGYDCVPEQHLEAAFALGGKGTRAPQTCIPEPCDQVFSEATLAGYAGFQDAAHYRDYRSRMTKVCGAPSIWEEKGITNEQLLWAVFDGGSPPILLAEAWPVGGVLPEFPSLWPVVTNRTGGGSGGWDGFGGGGGGGTSIFDRPPTEGPFPPGIPPVRETSKGERPEVPTHAPLPAPFFLLAAAAGALVLLKRMRRRASL